MKIDIVTCFESNEERVSFIYDLCKKQGFTVKAITTDFSHRNKEKRNNVPNYFKTINTIPYKNNMSVGRLMSHKKFAKDAFIEIEKDDPDLIWVVAPALSLIKEANIYKQNHNCKIIIDIIDMWPESLPLGSLKKLFPFKLWKKIREDNINVADEVVTECDLYQEILSKEYKGKLTTLYWAKDVFLTRKEIVENDTLNLCYIGSINNIIDIDLIKKIIKKFNRNVVLDIIGFGEKTEEMVSKLKDVCKVIYHGPIFDETEKEKIISKCLAGINIYKKDLYIGLTVKSMDYLRYGLPIINNIKGDTYNFVEKYNIGINVDETKDIDENKLIEMRNNSQNITDFYNMHFSKNVFENKCLEILNRVINK